MPEQLMQGDPGEGEKRGGVWLSSRALLALALGYLLLPNVLFLLGWVRLEWALPLSLALLVGAVHVWRKAPVRRFALSGRELVLWALVALLCLIWVESIGLNGHVIQHNDFLVRHAIYDSLVRDGWPLYSARGEYFSYYMAFWLPPALCSRLVGEGGVDRNVLLYLWMYAGVLISFLALLRRGGLRTLAFLLLLMVLGDVSDWYDFYLNPLAQKMENTPGGVGAFARWFLGMWPYVDFPYCMSWVQLRNLFNHIIPVWVFLSVVMGKLLRPRHLLFVSTLVVICSPLAALALLPLLGWTLWPQLRREGMSVLLNGTTLLGGAYLVFPALYLGCNEGSRVFLTPLGLESTALKELPPTGWMLMILLAWATIVLPAWVFLRRYRRTAAFRTFLLLALLLPFIFVGTRFNELCMKGSGVMWYCLAWLYASCVFYASRRRLWKMALYVFFSAPMAILCVSMLLIKNYSWDPDVMQLHRREEWQGHLNHPEDPMYPSFWGRQPSPALFYALPGESPLAPAERKP